MFNAEKVLQIITYLLSLNDGKMNKLKLMKELYLMDRASISERNTSLSGDEFYSLSHGPVLSNTLTTMNDIAHDNPWGDFLSLNRYDVELVRSAGTGRLSRKDKKYIEHISEEFRHMDQYAIRAEWVDPRGSNRKIYFRDVMKALGKSEEETEQAKREYEAIYEIYGTLATE